MGENVEKEITLKINRENMVAACFRREFEIIEM